jgi:small subunit ribosomal protein S4
MKKRTVGAAIPATIWSSCSSVASTPWSYSVRDGDAIELTAKAKGMALVLEAAQSGERDVPDYVEIDHDRMRGRFIRAPKPTDVPYPVTMEPNLVIEYYSR